MASGADRFRRVSWSGTSGRMSSAGLRKNSRLQQLRRCYEQFVRRKMAERLPCRRRRQIRVPGAGVGGLDRAEVLWSVVEEYFRLKRRKRCDSNSEMEGMDP